MLPLWHHLWQCAVIIWLKVNPRGLWIQEATRHGVMFHMFVCMSALKDISDLCFSIWLNIGLLWQNVYSHFLQCVWPILFLLPCQKFVEKKNCKVTQILNIPFFELFTCANKKSRHFSIFKQDLQGFATLPSSLCPSKKEYASHISKTFFKRFPLA